jgi:superfamily II DNA/RNA helicase
VPELINVSEDHLIPLHVDHVSAVCDSQDRLAATIFFLKQEWNTHKQSGNDQQFQCIVFVDNDQEINIYSQRMSSALEKHGVIEKEEKIACLTANMNIESRRANLMDFRNGDSIVLLCSDLASRGLDVPNNVLVIQMSLPKSADDYVHRAGRTGRLNRYGKVITLIQKEEEFVLKRYMNELGIEIRCLQMKPKAPH